MLAEMTAGIVVKKLQESKCNNEKDESDEHEYVDCVEAARILGVGPNYLRMIKNKFPHQKVGNTKQGRLMFLRSALLPTYFGRN